MYLNAFPAQDTKQLGVINEIYLGLISHIESSMKFIVQRRGASITRFTI